MQEKDYRDLGRDLQIEFEGIRYDNDHEGVLHSKDPYISLISLARNKRISPLELYIFSQNLFDFVFVPMARKPASLPFNFDTLIICITNPRID